MKRPFRITVFNTVLICPTKDISKIENKHSRWLCSYSPYSSKLESPNIPSWVREICETEHPSRLYAPSLPCTFCGLIGVKGYAALLPALPEIVLRVGAV